MSRQTTSKTGLKYVLGYDVEATGQCMRLHFMPRFGAALVEIASLKTVATFSRFCAAPPGRTWEKRCLDEFWLKPDNKAQYDEIVEGLKTAPSLEQAGLDFVEWVRELQARLGTDSMMLGSDTAGFDYAWLTSALPPGTSLLYLFGPYRPTMAVSNFYGGVARVTPTQSFWGLLGSCCDVLHIEKPKAAVPHDHNPEHDAETIAFEAASVIRHLDTLTASPRKRAAAA